MREAGVPFALGGSLACWARGGPPTDNDVDLIFARLGVRVTERLIDDVSGAQRPGSDRVRRRRRLLPLSPGGGRSVAAWVICRRG